MKKNMLLCTLSLLLSTQAWAQLRNQNATIIITSGSHINALDGVVNANGATLTVEGTLSTPADLTNTSGATLQGNGQYQIGGNWTNDATFSAETSTVTFDGDQNSTVISGGGAFYALHLNKTAADLLLADNMDVTNTLDFQANENFVVLTDFNLQAGDILGYEAARHVRTTGAGFLIRTVGASPVDFPIGNTAYNPATLTNAGTADLYRVRVANAVLSGGQTGSPLAADAVGRGWFIEEETPGGSDLSLTVQWNGGEELAGFDRTQAYVSHYLAGSWDSQPTAAASGADPYTLSRSGISSLSPFAVLGHNFSALIDILGTILWEHDGSSGVKDANVALTGDDTDSDLTATDGTYSLTASGGSNFTVTPTKNINKLNGITVADATAVQQHVTGVNPITNPYKQVAADVNKSNSITTFDATIINQSLLGNPSALAQFKASWRFVPVTFNLSIPPWGFPEKIDLTGVSGNAPDQDFWGVKIGDLVPTHANPANLTPPPPLVLRTVDAALHAGETLTAVVRADAFKDLAAWQFALRFDPERLALAAVEPLDRMPVSEDNFGKFNSSKGELRSVWSQANGIALTEAEPVFQLKFNVLKSGGKLSEALRLDGATLPALAYNSNLLESGVELRFEQATSVSNGGQPSTLLEAWPNPFVHTTNVRFSLPEACQAQLRVLDAAGRELWRLDKNYPAGYQQETIRLEGVNGALVCELTTPWGVRSLKMVGVE